MPVGGMGDRNALVTGETRSPIAAHHPLGDLFSGTVQLLGAGQNPTGDTDLSPHIGPGALFNAMLLL